MTYRLFTAFVVLAILLATPASGTVGVRFDSAWWNSLDADEKISAVEGMITGEQYAYFIGKMDEADAILRDKSLFQNKAYVLRAEQMRCKARLTQFTLAKNSRRISTVSTTFI